MKKGYAKKSSGKKCCMPHEKVQNVKGSAEMKKSGKKKG